MKALVDNVSELEVRGFTLDKPSSLPPEDRCPPHLLAFSAARARACVCVLGGGVRSCVGMVRLAHLEDVSAMVSWDGMVSERRGSLKSVGV